MRAAAFVVAHLAAAYLTPPVADVTNPVAVRAAAHDVDIDELRREQAAAKVAAREQVAAGGEEIARETPWTPPPTLPPTLAPAVGVPSAADWCFPLEGGCDVVRDMCGAEFTDVLDPKGSPCATFAYGVGAAYQDCEGMGTAYEGKTLAFTHCFYEQMPRDACEVVCAHEPPGLGTPGLPLRPCEARCTQWKVCATRCRDAYRKYELEACFNSCFAEAPFHPTSTCAGRCGGHAANGKCFCDITCLYDHDCCDDFESACPNEVKDDKPSFLARTGKPAARARASPALLSSSSAAR
jgi:hypothetical protein